MTADAHLAEMSAGGCFHLLFCSDLFSVNTRQALEIRLASLTGNVEQGDRMLPQTMGSVSGWLYARFSEASHLTLSYLDFGARARARTVSSHGQTQIKHHLWINMALSKVHCINCRQTEKW